MDALSTQNAELAAANVALAVAYGPGAPNPDKILSCVCADGTALTVCAAVTCAPGDTVEQCGQARRAADGPGPRWRRGAKE